VIELLKGSSKAIGIKQSLKAVEADSVKMVFLAGDADEKIISGLKIICQQKNIEVFYVETMKQLGKACGIEVGASAVCLLK